MFYISKASLKNLAKDTRRFSFVGSGVNAVTNLVGWSVMHHQESPMVMAGLAILWFVVFQVIAVIVDSLTESHIKNPSHSALRPAHKKRAQNALGRKP
jgi:hypothetical protein